MDDDTVKLNLIGFTQKPIDNNTSDTKEESGVSIFAEQDSIQELENDEEIGKALSEAVQNEEYGDVSQQLYDSMAGIGTDRESFDEILNNEDLNGIDWVNIIQSFNQEYGTDFISMVNNEYTGPKENKDIMEIISSKLLEALNDGNEDALDIIVNGLNSVLHSIESSEFATNILKGSSIDDFKLISDKYKEITGSDLKQDVINNRKISKEDKDLISSKFNPNDTIIKENVKKGTYLSQAISDANSKEDVYNILLEYCNGNEENAQIFFDYLGLSNQEENIYKNVPQSTIMNKIYTNVGNNFVLNQDLLDRFAQYETYGIDEKGQELKRPSKEFYTNYDGELCSIDYSYNEANESDYDTITMTFNEGEKSKELTFYITSNEKGEVFYNIYNNPNEDIIENKEQFKERLIVLKNYTNESSDQVLSSDEVKERYVLLKQHDESIGNTLTILMDQFQKEGAIDNLRNHLADISESFGKLSDKDIMDEVSAAIIYDQIILDYKNGNTDEAKELINAEFDRRIQNAHTYQEVYKELFAYYQNSDTAFEVLKNNVPSYMELTLDKDNNTVTAFDPVTESNFDGNLSLSLDKLKGFEELDMTLEDAYKFLTYRGSYSVDNVKNFETAERMFSGYNAIVAYGSELQNCKTPSDAFKLITGKDFGSCDINDEDIALFESYYNKENQEPMRYMGANADGYEFMHYYTVSAKVNKDTNSIELEYKQFRKTVSGWQEISQDDPEFLNNIGLNEGQDNLFADFNTKNDDNIVQLQKQNFGEFYDRNKEAIDNYIDNYASWAINDPESRKYFEKLMGKDIDSNAIAKYIKLNKTRMFEQSAKFMQYNYTTTKQELYGESRLDNLTNDYCTDMATYSKKLSRMLSVGCMLTSVAIPTLSPVLMPMAKAAGYLDNAIDFGNKMSNGLDSVYDNYDQLIKSTVTEFVIKKGYRFFSDIAGDKASEFTEYIKNNSPFGGAMSASPLLQTIIKGTSEALIETGICIPYTVAIQAFQGGEYDFWAELTENFFYDFLPYARGWQDLLIDKPNKFVSTGENEGLYLDELGRPMKFVAIVAGEEFVRARYEYDGDNYKVIETQDDGSETVKQVTKKPDGTMMIEMNGKICQDTEKLEDGSYKTTYFDDDGNEKQIITDNEGHILKSISDNMTIEYNQSGSVKNISSTTANGKNLSIKYSTVQGITTAKVNIDGSEFEYKVNKDGIATIIDNNGQEITLNEKILLGQLDLGYSLDKGKNDLILMSSLSNVTQDDNTTCALAAEINAIAQKPMLLQTLMQQFEYDITSGTWKSNLFGEEIEIPLKPGSNFLEELYKSYKNVYGDDATFDDVSQVFNKLFETGEDICVKPDFTNFADIKKLQGCLNDEYGILTFNTESYDIEGIEPGHAYTVININDLGNMTLVDPQDPEKLIYVTRAQLENAQDYQFEGKTLTPGKGWVEDDSYMRLVAGKAETSKIDSLDSKNSYIFNDPKNFAEYLSSRLENELDVKSTEDVENIIHNVSKQTGVHESVVTNLLARITQFSSYSQLPEISNQLCELGIKGFAYNVPNSLNKVFSYIGSEKFQINLYGGEDGKTGFFVDDASIKYLSDLKTENPAEFSSLCEKIKNGEIVLLQIDGWNAKADGSALSYTMYGAESSLESTVMKLANLLKDSDYDIDKLLSGQTEDMLRSILGFDTTINTIKNSQINPTPEGISENMRPIMPDAKKIEKTINVILDNIVTGPKGEGLNEEDRALATSALTKYFNEMIDVYSAQRLNSDLKAKYETIEQKVLEMGKTMEDVYYIIPSADARHGITAKSFDLINYSYKKINNIPDDKFIYYSYGESLPEDCSSKVFVFLDDIVGSGESMYNSNFFSYPNFESLNPEAKFIFSPISTLQEGYEYIAYGEYGSEDNEVVPSIIVDYDNTLKSILTPEEYNIFGKIVGDIGYRQGGACTVMPYMMPDNNSDVSWIIGSLFVNNPIDLAIGRCGKLISGGKGDGWNHNWRISYKDLIEAILGD